MAGLMVPKIRLGGANNIRMMLFLYYFSTEVELDGLIPQTSPSSHRAYGDKKRESGVAK